MFKYICPESLKMHFYFAFFAIYVIKNNGFFSFYIGDHIRIRTKKIMAEIKK